MKEGRWITHHESADILERVRAEKIAKRQAYFRSFHGDDQYTPCDKCLDRESCPYVYDLYNNDDDCLATK